MEDDLKILKGEYFSKQQTQIVNLSLDDQTIMYKSSTGRILFKFYTFYNYFKCRQPPMEDDLIISKVKYLSKVLKSSKWKWLPMEDNLKILNVEYFSNHLWDPTPILNLSLDDQTIMYKSI
jgi:hypothetical protein